MGIALRVALLVVTLLSVGAQLRTVRTVGTAGLSAATWFGLVTSTTFWLGYGLLTQEPTLIAINLPVLAIALTLAAAIVRAGVAPLRAAVPWLAVPLACWAVAFATGSPALLGLGGTVLVVGRLLPQAVVAARAEDRSGVSVGAWVGNGTNKVAWAAYGFWIGDLVVAWPAVVAAVVSFGVVALVRVPRRSVPAPEAPHGPVLPAPAAVGSAQ